MPAWHMRKRQDTVMCCKKVSSRLKKKLKKELQQPVCQTVSDKLKYVQLLQRLWQARIRGFHGIIKWGSRQRGS